MATARACQEESAILEYCQRWLSLTGRSYEPAARDALARAHPTLFGVLYQVTLRGYERWLVRQGRKDSLEAFSRYISPRFRRWPSDGDGTTSLPTLAEAGGFP